MKNSRQLWLKASKLLSNSEIFDQEQDRILQNYPTLNSLGLGCMSRQYPIVSPGGNSTESLETRYIPEDWVAARDALRAGGQCESGIRNTLEYFVEGRVSLSYHLKGCD